MAISETAQRAVCAAKEASMGEDGAIDIQTRRAQCPGGGISVNITDIGQRVHGIEAGDTVTVVVHGDGIVILPEKEEEEE